MNYDTGLSNGRVNPYNFVRLGNGTARTAPQRGVNTGVIHCRLKTAVPLAVPDPTSARFVMTDDGRPEHREMDFFRIGGKYVIPGSEIRGVIRSAYETLSDSCLSVNNNNILSARSSDVRNPGILRWESSDRRWHLYKAKSRKLKYDGSEDFDETPDTFKRTWLNFRYENKKRLGDKKVVVTYKFTTEFEEVEAEDLESAVKDYKNVCDIYKENVPGIGHHIRLLQPGGNGYPVYYLEYFSEGTKYVYLSPAQISRSVFRKRVDDLLGSYSHCSNTEEVCEACGLFGMIGERAVMRKGAPSAIASRVRFTDAEAVGDIKYIKAVLRELSSPKLSSVEFYSHFGSGSRMKKLWTYDDKGLSLNGRKYYFHHSGNYSTSEKTNRNITAELADKDSVFEFDVYFENLTGRELERLVWTLAIGENDENGRQMHKLGHGKPLGLGSVKITVTSVTRREFDRESMRFSEISEDVGKYFLKVPFDESAGYFRDYMNVTDFDYIPADKSVNYPYGDDKKGSKTSQGTLTWFKANHNDGMMVKAGEGCSVRYRLPRIAEEKPDKSSLVLPALIKSGSGSSAKEQGGGNKKGGGYSGKTYFEGSSSSKPIMIKVKCTYCKAENEVESSGSIMKSPKNVVCKKCRKTFKTKPL